MSDGIGSRVALVTPSMIRNMVGAAEYDGRLELAAEIKAVKPHTENGQRELRRLLGELFTAPASKAEPDKAADT